MIQEALFEMPTPVALTEPLIKVVHCKKEQYDIYIGRPAPGLPGSIWVNPFVIGKDGTRDEVIEKYRQYVLSKPELLGQLESLRGKVLACWCSPQKCHGDVLIELLSGGKLPPKPPTPVAVAEPLGPCVKCKKAPATLRSPGGSVYCEECGQCKRQEIVMNGDKVVLDMHGRAVTKRVCFISVEDFVWSNGLKMHVCPCVVKEIMLRGVTR